MRKLIILILVCLVSDISAAVSFVRAQYLYNKVLMANNVGAAPRLRHSPSLKANASANLAGITVNEGMLRFVNNEVELLLVISHELAHYTLHHTGSTHSNEYSADKLGSMYLSRTGYSVCKGAIILKRFNSPASKTHPSSLSRYQRLCRR